MRHVHVSVVTPTFNRGRELKKLYKSLRSQTIDSFDWVIVDDGSTDNTFEIVNEMKKKANGFVIKYERKENGGKHTALNSAFDMINDGLLVIVDSDDYLVEDAIETIVLDWEKYKDKGLCGICYKSIPSTGEDLLGDFGKRETISTYGDFIVNKGRKGETTEVFSAKMLNGWRFPVFGNERFLAEGAFWCKVSREHKMLFVDKAICIYDYLQDGLTKSGKSLRIKNPHGGMYCAGEFLNRKYNLCLREKKALLYLIYARFAGRNVWDECKKNDNSLLLFFNVIPSYFVYKYWSKKYNGEGGHNG